MKYLLILFSVLVMVSCAGSRSVYNYEEDTYFSMADARANRQRNVFMSASSNQASFSVTENQDSRNALPGREGADRFQRDEFGNIIISDGFETTPYTLDEYHDFGYTARVRRFGAQSGTWGYYDPYHTNMYWYTHNPGNWGTSIYQTYPWWAHGSNSNMFNGGWGMGCNPMWNPWHNPYSWSNPWNNSFYGWGYNPWMPYGTTGFGGGWGMAPGFWGNPYAGMGGGGFYYNSFDQNTYDYGARQFGRAGSSNNQGGGGNTFARVVSETTPPRVREPIRSIHVNDVRSTHGSPIRTTNTGRTPADNVSGTSPARNTDNISPARSNPSNAIRINSSRNTEGSPVDSRNRFDNRIENGMPSPANRNIQPNIQRNTQDNSGRKGSFQEGSRTIPSAPRSPAPQYSPSPSQSRPTQTAPQRSSGSYSPAPSGRSSSGSSPSPSRSGGSSSSPRSPR